MVLGLLLEKCAAMQHRGGACQVQLRQEQAGPVCRKPGDMRCGQKSDARCDGDVMFFPDSLYALYWSVPHALLSMLPGYLTRQLGLSVDLFLGFTQLNWRSKTIKLFHFRTDQITTNASVFVKETHLLDLYQQNILKKIALSAVQLPAKHVHN